MPEPTTVLAWAGMIGAVALVRRVRKIAGTRPDLDGDAGSRPGSKDLTSPRRPHPRRPGALVLRTPLGMIDAGWVRPAGCTNRLPRTRGLQHRSMSLPTDRPRPPATSTSPRSPTSPAAVARAIRTQPDRPTACSAGGSVAMTVGQPGDRRDRPDRPRGGRRRSARSGFEPVRRRRDGEPRRRDAPRASGRSWPSSASPRTSVGCPIRSEMDTVGPRAPTPSACRSTSTGTPSRPTGSSCSTGSSRTPRSPAGTRAACSRCSPIGLGKRQGAAQVHKLGLPGLKTLLPEVGAFLLERTPVALGLAILENADEHTARVVAGRARGAARGRAPPARRGPRR